MKRLTAILGLTAAGLTVLVTGLAPFLWFNVFTGAVSAAGLRIDPVYTGGEPARVIARQGYQIIIYHPVPQRALLPRIGPFVQLAWKPAAALPARVTEEIDLDNDNKPDLVASFDVPRDTKTDLRVDVQPLTPRVLAMSGVGQDSFSRLIARVNDAIVVRVPLRNAGK